MSLVDRDQREKFLAAIDGSSTLVRPVCRGWVGDHHIAGKYGFVLAAPPVYLLYATIDEAGDREPSSRPWSRAKVTLGLCRVIQDGDWEGCLYLDRLPNAAEAVAIREILGIRKQKAVTEETKARLRSQLETSRSLSKSAKLDQPLRRRAACDQLKRPLVVVTDVDCAICPTRICHDFRHRARVLPRKLQHAACAAASRAAKPRFAASNRDRA